MSQCDQRSSLVHFAIKTNIFWSLDKCILQFRQISNVHSIVWNVIDWDIPYMSQCDQRSSLLHSRIEKSTPDSCSIKLALLLFCNNSVKIQDLERSWHVVLYNWLWIQFWAIPYNWLCYNSGPAAAVQLNRIKDTLESLSDALGKDVQLYVSVSVWHCKIEITPDPVSCCVQLVMLQNIFFTCPPTKILVWKT